MPWFILMFIIMISGFLYLGYKYGKNDEDIILGSIIGTILSSIILLIILSVGYIDTYNNFINVYNKIEGEREVIKVLEKQELKVLDLFRIEVSGYLTHEEGTLENLKVDNDNLYAVLNKYPELRSSEVVKQYLVDIKDLRMQITNGEKELFKLVALYNAYSERSFRKHFRPNHLEKRLVY